MAKNYEKILVTGAGGGIGKFLVKYLLEHTDYTLTLGYYAENEIPNYIEKYSKRIKIVTGDISQRETLERLFQNVSTVIHLASTVSPNGFNQTWGEAYKFGANSTFAILDYLQNCSNKRHVIFPSSGGTVYSDYKTEPYKESDTTNGISPYGIQKVMFENYLQLLVNRNQNISCNILRISNPYGISLNRERKQGFIDITLQKVFNNETIELWSNKNTTRDYIYITDLCEAIVKMINYRNGLEIFNIGSGVGTTLEDVLKAIGQLLNSPIEYQQKRVNFYYPQYNVLDIQKVKSLIHWEPKTTLQNGLKNIITEHFGEEHVHTNCNKIRN